jgi:hypothetical protein
MQIPERIIKTLPPPPAKRPLSSLTPPEIACLEMYMFSSMLFVDIYRLFFKTVDMKEAAVRREAEQLLSGPDAQVYLADRRNQFDAWMAGLKGEEETVEEVEAEEVLDESGDYTPETLRRLKVQIVKLADQGDTDALKKMMDFVLKQSKAQIDGVAPIRVLAETCHDCRMKEFYDKVKEGVDTFGQLTFDFDKKSQTLILQTNGN